MRRGLLAATVRGGLLAAAVLLLAAGAAGAAPTWLAPFDPLPASTDFPSVPAMNAGGEILFADEADLGGGRRAVRIADRPPGGSVGAPVLFPPAGSTTLGFVPALALADDGHAIVAWVDGGGAFFALRSPDGSWGATTPVPGATHVTSVAVGISATGGATLGWAENTNTNPGFMNPNDLDVQVARITPAGSVSSSQTLLTTTGTTIAAGVQALRVTGSGRAILLYGLSSMGFPAGSTAVFRDAAGGTFGDSTDLGGGIITGFRGAIGDGGRSAFVEGSGTSIVLRVRDPSGPLGPPIDVNGGGNVANALVGVAGDGAITLAWDIQVDADPRAMACTATPTECVGDPQRLSRPGGSLSLTSLAVNPAGAALVAWNTIQTSPTVVFGSSAALRPAAGATFGAAQDVAAPPAQNASVALDAAGDGVAAFIAGTGFGRPLMAAGLDATGPRIDAFAAPATIDQGARATFSASTSDLWSAVTGLDWSFGDGASASGGAVSHAFARAGSVPVTLTATDAVGNSSSRTATVTVRDTRRPRIEKLAISSRRFRVGARATAKSAAAKRRARHGGVPVGTTIRYALSEAGTATFRIERPQAGRRVGRACRKPTRANRRHRACTRYKTVGTLTRHAAGGANALAFSGRIGRKALAPGSYRLTLTARDAAGNRSTPRSLAFAIVSG